MTRTKIHISKKLENLVKRLVQTDQDFECGILGKWNATVFYIDRKKCLLITNGYSKYNVILTDVKSSEMGEFESIFKEKLFSQLLYDEIDIDFENLNTIIGEIDFARTDNDRSTIGFQNQNLYLLEYWKHEFGKLETMPIQDLTNRLNTTPIHIGKGRKISDYTTSAKEMKRMLEKL